MFRRIGFGIAAAFLTLAWLLPAAARSQPNRHEIILGLRGDGPFRIEGCAEDLTRRQRPLAAAFADGSDSLDAINARFQGAALAMGGDISRRSDVAALVARAAELCEKYERPVATAAQAREILGLRAA